MERPLTCLHVIASSALDWGGPSRVIREMTSALADRGHRLIVLSADQAKARRPPGSQPPFDPRVDHHIHTFDFARAPWPSTSLLIDLLRQLPRIDLAHVHGLFNAPCSSTMAALRAARVPYVLRPCGMLDPFSLRQRERSKALWWRLLDGPNARGAAAIQCSTPHEVAAVQSALASIPGRSSRVVECPQGVSPLPSPTDPDSPHPRPYALFLGRVATKKGLIPLVKALVERASGTAVSTLDLVIVGPDERGHAAEVRQLVDSLGLARRVRLVGPVFDVHEKARWYAHAAAFCLPSADENFGLTVVEASRFGVPLLVSPDVGLAPAIAKNGAGLVVPAEPPEIAGALAELVGAHRPAFSEGARRLGAAFEWPERAADLEAVYYEAAARR